MKLSKDHHYLPKTKSLASSQAQQEQEQQPQYYDDKITYSSEDDISVTDEDVFVNHASHWTFRGDIKAGVNHADQFKVIGSFSGECWGNHCYYELFDGIMFGTGNVCGRFRGVMKGANNTIIWPDETEYNEAKLATTPAFPTTTFDKAATVIYRSMKSSLVGSLTTTAWSFANCLVEDLISVDGLLFRRRVMSPKHESLSISGNIFYVNQKPLGLAPWQVECNLLTNKDIGIKSNVQHATITATTPPTSLPSLTNLGHHYHPLESADVALTDDEDEDYDMLDIENRPKEWHEQSVIDEILSSVSPVAAVIDVRGKGKTRVEGQRLTPHLSRPEPIAYRMPKIPSYQQQQQQQQRSLPSPSNLIHDNIDTNTNTPISSRSSCALCDSTTPYGKWVTCQGGYGGASSIHTNYICPTCDDMVRYCLTCGALCV